MRTRLKAAAASLTAIIVSFTWLAGSNAHAALSPEDLYEQVAPSVMTLSVETAGGDSFLGNAFLMYESDLAVTAWHVVYDATRIVCRFSDRESVGVLGCVDHDSKNDLAIIKLAKPMVKRPLLRAASASPRTGSQIYVIGAPKGFDFSISPGLLSQQRKIEGIPHYQLACPISSGNSGGPVLNGNGEVIGLVSWRQPEAESLGFAIPANSFSLLHLKAQPVPLPQLIAEARSAPSGGIVVHDPKQTGSTDDFQKFLAERPGRKVNITCTEEGQTYRFEVDSGFQK